LRPIAEGLVTWPDGPYQELFSKWLKLAELVIQETRLSQNERNGKGNWHEIT
jgi:hypothetical protein